MMSNLLLLLIITFTVISYFAFVLPKKDKILFKLYEERDKLTLYIMNSPGKQNTEEYKYLIGMINTEIYLVKNSISFTKFFTTTVEQSVENEKKIEKIINKIKEDEFMYDIYNRSFSIFTSYFNRKFKWFRILVLFPTCIVLEFILKILKIITKSERHNKVDIVVSKATNVSKVYERYIRLNNGVA